MTAALHTLLEHAERQRDEAALRLRQAEDHAQRLQLQAQQLHTYRDEYRQRHPAQGGRVAHIEVLRCHQDFMTRIDQALLQQQGQQKAADMRVAELRSELLALETRLASVRKLMERRRHEARRGAERADQRQTDEAAQRRRRDEAQQAGTWRGATRPAPLTH